jgi:predicted lysophospholipase L1 biosynthesis ABC-type transport system permease subunit
LPSVIWSEKGPILKYILVSLVSIISGLVVGYGIQWILGSSLHPSIAALFSVAVVIVIIFSLKNISANELLLIVKGIVK